MGRPNALRALDPVWFRFTDPQDAGKFGDRWYKYDEGAVLRLRSQELIRLETDLGMPIIAVMNGFRDSTVLGDTAAAWLGVRAVDPARAGDFDQFDIVSMMLEWSKDAPEPDPKDESPADTLTLEASILPMADFPSESTTSDRTDTVVLQTSPIVGS